MFILRVLAASPPFYLICARHLCIEIPIVFFRQRYAYSSTTMAEYTNTTMSNSGEQNG